MAQNLQIVFARIPAEVDEDEFNAWYDAHLSEILSIPGFVSAQRYRLESVVVDSEQPVSYRYLSVYEIEGDPDRLLAEMERVNLGTADAYRERKAVDASGPELPEWWNKVRFASWNCLAIGERVTAS
jgi:hypothetical protein